uniref:Venom protein n=1 Tax=Hadrurus spadix TaxID=141984 RepID=A0A1W7R957_9SCOR
MGFKFCLIAFILTAIFVNVMTLRCRVCGTYECRPPPRNCPVGTVTDICNCCLVCGKAENEICGGDWDLRGKCGYGLRCVKRRKTGVCKKE